MGPFANKHAIHGPMARILLRSSQGQATPSNPLNDMIVNVLSHPWARHGSIPLTMPPWPDVVYS